MAKKKSKPRKGLDLTLPIYEVKITLQYINPPIWRRLQTNDCSLHELHDIIQVCMGWEDEHMYAFVIESPKEAVVREVMEESGYHTRAGKLLAVWDRAKHPHTPPFPYHIYKICILCELIGGEATASKETEDVGFYPEDGLPDLSISRVTPGQIARLFEHHRDSNLPTDLD